VHRLDQIDAKRIKVVRVHLPKELEGGSLCLLEPAEATLLASPSSDAMLDVAADGRQALADSIRAVFEQAECALIDDVMHIHKRQTPPGRGLGWR